MIHVICGAPCAGKTSYIQQRAKPGDLVIDTDKIAEALGAGVDHMAEGICYKAALEAREAAIRIAKKSEGDSWIIHSLPSEQQIADYQRHNAEIIVLDPGIDECKRRAKNRPAGTMEAIDRWYNIPPRGFNQPRSGPEKGQKTMLTSEQVREIVSKETGIPADLLSGETQEEIIAHARAILEFKYSQDDAQGQEGQTAQQPRQPKTTAEQFAAWAAAALGEHTPEDNGLAGTLDAMAQEAEQAHGYAPFRDPGEPTAPAPMPPSAAEQFSEWAALNGIGWD